MTGTMGVLPVAIPMGDTHMASINGYDISYSLGLGVASPIWMARSSSRHKVLCALGQRMGHVQPRLNGNPAVLIHAVSLGEMNATRELVNQLQTARPNFHVVITTTTVTGYARGRQLYGGNPGVTLVHYPLDFTPAIDRLLDAMKPNLIVLMEGEIWPNFLKQCEQRKIPVLLVNGRISESAFARYRKIKFVTPGMLRRIQMICAQDQVYADRFSAIGAPADRVQVTGNMKFDTATIADKVSGDDQLAADVGLVPGDGPIWVCGSTGPGEEALLLNAYRTLQQKFPTLRLVIVPRDNKRFDQVTDEIQQAGFDLVRRSKPVSEVLRRAGSSGENKPIILGDTMGELRKFYSLATIVFVGRSLIDLGSRQWGSDMIEPAALAKPVTIGPWTQNFAEAVRSFKAENAMIEVANAQSLVETLVRWLSNPTEANEIGKRAQQVVRANQGATAKHVELMLKYLPKAP
jgi:3-deoxy-D-manno-octulosonic-acid transferase